MFNQFFKHNRHREVPVIGGKFFRRFDGKHCFDLVFENSDGEIKTIARNVEFFAPFSENAVVMPKTVFGKNGYIVVIFVEDGKPVPAIGYISNLGFAVYYKDGDLIKYTKDRYETTIYYKAQLSALGLPEGGTLEFHDDYFCFETEKRAFVKQEFFDYDGNPHYKYRAQYTSQVIMGELKSILSGGMLSAEGPDEYMDIINDVLFNSSCVSPEAVLKLVDAECRFAEPDKEIATALKRLAEGFDKSRVLLFERYIKALLLATDELYGKISIEKVFQRVDVIFDTAVSDYGETVFDDPDCFNNLLLSIDGLE